MSDRPGITQELRNSMNCYDNFDGTSRVVLGESGFNKLCDQIDSIHAALEAKNERISESKTISDLAKEVTAYVAQLQAENAKLRELLAEMYPCAKAYLQEWLVVGGIDSKSYDWYLRLRELGVEVD